MHTQISCLGTKNLVEGKTCIPLFFFFYFGVLVDCGLMPHQQLRSYGDEASVYSSMQRTGEARD